MIAGSQRKFDVYAGIDCFGRGCYGGGGWNTYKVESRFILLTVLVVLVVVRVRPTLMVVVTSSVLLIINKLR